MNAYVSFHWQSILKMWRHSHRLHSPSYVFNFFLFAFAFFSSSTLSETFPPWWDGRMVKNNNTAINLQPPTLPSLIFFRSPPKFFFSSWGFERSLEGEQYAKRAKFPQVFSSSIFSPENRFLTAAADVPPSPRSFLGQMRFPPPSLRRMEQRRKHEKKGEIMKN